MINTKEKKYDLLVVGELNIDLILDQLNKAPHFGKEQRAENMTLTLGSSSAIFAANCSSLGARVAFTGKIGHDSFGKHVVQSLSDKGINSDYIITDKGVKTGATVIFNYNGNRMMVTHPGAMEKMTVNEIPNQLFNECRHLHTSAIFFQPAIKKDLSELFQKAKSHGMTTSMDTQWDPDEKWDLDLGTLLPVLDFFLPNDQELMELTKCKSVDDALDQLKVYDTTIVVKQGEKGATLAKKGEKISIPAYSVPNYVDAIGAGDSFDSGFIYTFLNGKSLRECLEFGNLTAAVSTTEAGGTSAVKNYEYISEHYHKLELYTV